MRIDGKGIIDRTCPSLPLRRGNTALQGLHLASALFGQWRPPDGAQLRITPARRVDRRVGGAERAGRGPRVNQTPNVRRLQEVFDGLEARSQNRLGPSLRPAAVNDLMAPFFSAVYYKTFMWPRAFWESLYEPAIRRAAAWAACRGGTTRSTRRLMPFCDLGTDGGAGGGALGGDDPADENPVLGGRLVSTSAI